MPGLGRNAEAYHRLQHIPRRIQVPSLTLASQQLHEHGIILRRNVPLHHLPQHIPRLRRLLRVTQPRQQRGKRDRIRLNPAILHLLKNLHCPINPPRRDIPFQHCGKTNHIGRNITPPLHLREQLLRLLHLLKPQKPVNQSVVRHNIGRNPPALHILVKPNRGVQPQRQKHPPQKNVKRVARGLHALPQHRVVVPLRHQVASAAENDLEERVVGLHGALHAELLHLPEDLDGLLDDPGAAVAVDEGDERVLGAVRARAVEEDAAGVVEPGVAAEDLDDLEGGVRGVGEEADALDPAVELEGVVGGGGGAVEDVVDEGGVEPRDQGADRVLQARGPGAVRHHAADGEFEVLVAQRGLGLGWVGERGEEGGRARREPRRWRREREGRDGEWASVGEVSNWKAEP
ncbi:hypothetical protein E2542_SST16911 [Spatholobus suberectus]|nr:hypothetical protein E2542_SST16911 [Spatholobus suberectus]